MILICEMEQQIIEKTKGKSKLNFSEDKAYFQSQIHINLDKNRCESHSLSDVKRNYDKLS